MKTEPIGPPPLYPLKQSETITADSPASLQGKVGVIEFDDMGELWDRCSLDEGAPSCQLREVLSWVEAESTAAENAGARPITLVFIHGWHHNANSKDDNLNRFQKKIFDLQTDADRRDGSSKKTRYIGVYLGWRARTLKAPTWSRLSWADPDYGAFFDRETTAGRTSLVSMEETLLRLREASKGSNSSSGAAPKPLFLVIGHSFGGLIVERIMSQMLTETIVTKDGTGECIKPLADLIVLLNPAADGILTQETIDMMRRSKVRTCATKRIGSDDDLAPPLIVSVTSVGDIATGKLYVGGHGISQIHMAFRKYPNCPFCGSNPPNQGTLYRHTAGHMPFFHNFCYLDGTGTTGDPICDQEQLFLGIESPHEESGTVIRSVARNAAPAKELRAYAQSDLSGGEFHTGVANLYRRCVTCLDPRRAPDCGQNWNTTGYWILSVPVSLSKGHDDIWNDNMSLFLKNVIDATAFTR
ncbi:MAG TPA: hypothetical protein VHY48_08200 [Acidobacteriaceae bacterium]|jgi:pimeloyl-ACP methyl ester carboxylesterase|nr:hypothetical protein [Acidobacteriaceae bacterium]